MAVIGINTWVWTSPLTSGAFRALAPHLASMGFDLVEVPIEQPGDFDYREAGRLARDIGLAVSVAAVIGTDRDLLHADASVAAAGAAYVRHCVDAAVDLGAVNIVGPFYSGVGRTWRCTPDERRRDVDRLVAGLRPLAAAAADRGVVLCLEPLNRFETSFVNLASQAIAIVDDVGSAGLALMLDTFHMNIEEASIGAAIRSAGARLRHVHACENDRGAPGSGHVPWRDVAAACRDIGFAGPFVIESFTPEHDSIARAASIWRPLAPSQDALARDGLAFLRSTL